MKKNLVMWLLLLLEYVAVLICDAELSRKTLTLGRWLETFHLMRFYLLLETFASIEFDKNTR